jgi:hypothetical protein
MFKATTSLGIPIAKGPLSDFRKFLFVIWKHLNLPDPTPVQYDIAYNLQHGDKRMIIEAFRGIGKSWVTSAYVVWPLYMNPQLNILVVSASKSRSDDFTTFTLRLINEIEGLAHLRPKTDQRQSKISFDVAPAAASHAPSVKSVVISGQLAGSRADVIVADDIEVPNNSITQGMLDKLSEAVKVFDAILKPDGRIIYLATPQNQESLYNKLPDIRSVTGQLGIRIQSNWSDTVAKYRLSLAMHWQSTLLLWVNLQTLTASQILTCSNGKHPTDAQVLHCSLCSIQGSQMQKDTMSRCLINRG